MMQDIVLQREGKFLDLTFQAVLYELGGGRGALKKRGLKHELESFVHNGVHPKNLSIPYNRILRKPDSKRRRHLHGRPSWKRSNKQPNFDEFYTSILELFIFAHG